jgi:cytosine/adenosine deaminase-related metal-dependent hydrolase
VRLRAAHVLPVAGDPIRDGAVAVRDGLITAVGAARDVAAAEPGLPERDLGAAVLLPGFVDAHCHLEWSLTGGLVDPGLGFAGWLGALLRLSPGMDDEDFAAASALGALRCLQHGTTTVADSGPTGAAAGALREAGLRGVVHLEVFGRQTGADARDAAARHAERTAALDARGLVRIGVSPHAPYTVGPELWEALAGHGDLTRRPWATHLAESPDESRLLTGGDGPLADLFAQRGTAPGVWPGVGGPVARLHAAGVLHPGLVAAHCVQLDPGDAELLAAAGVGVAHCPVSNRRLGCGRAPLTQLRAAGVAVGLGTDSPASAGAFDVREEARACAAVHRADGPLAPAAIVALATRGGAEALGLADVIGTLEVGKRADVVAVAAGAASDDPYAHVIAGGAVDLVMVDGDVVLDAGRPVRIDAGEVEERARRSRGRLTHP